MAPAAAPILPRLWQNQRVMAPNLARFILLGASIAVLAACLVEGSVSAVLGAAGTALFPPALFLLAEQDRSRIPLWIGLLAASLVAGLSIALLWRNSPAVAGLPAATWLTWLFAGALPFALIVVALVVRRPNT